MPRAFPRLSSRQHPIVRTFRALARGGGADGEILLDGAHLLAEAVEARVPIRALLVSSDFLARAAPADRRLVDRAARAGATVHEVSASVLDAASPVRTASGLVAAAAWSPADVRAAFAPEPALVVGLVDVQDPGNVGSAIRGADALGATGIIAIDRTAHPGGWKSLRGAMGSTFHLPVARGAWPIVLEAARAAGVRIAAAVAGARTPLQDADLRSPLLVLVGNEGSGIPDPIVAEADAQLAVPMRPGVNSLNVSVTSAIVLYEARRQRASQIPHERL